MAQLSRAQTLARSLAALEEGPLRTRAAARALAAGTPDEAVCLIADALALAGGGERMFVAALGEALLAPGTDLDYERLADIYAAAVEGQREEVRSLLVAPRPRKRWREPRDRGDPRLSHLTLGHKKAMARGDHDPDLLARLAAEGEPVVVRELLRNARMTEELVIRIAARRPCRPATLRCLHEDDRWRTRPAVARAIAMNPYAEPELVTKLLPRLGIDDLATIGADPSLHALVRALAKRLASGGTVRQGPSSPT